MMSHRSDAFRDRVLRYVDAVAWASEIRALIAECEARRGAARYDTGTISEAAALYLRGLTHILTPETIVEIGTFIGTSALAMLAGHPTAVIDTCDKSNDCGPTTDRIRCHPFTSSTGMLEQLRRKGRAVNLFFLDGRIEPADLPLMLELSTETTVYAFDDYDGREKGVLNVERLQPWLHPKRGYELVEPPPIAGVTIALLVPGAWL